MKYDIFISYRRTGGAQYARILQLMLSQRGYKVFLDYDELTDGKFGDHIQEAIKGAPIFMLVLSKDALVRCKNEGDWVRREIQLAVAEGKHIIPVNPDNSFNGMPADMPEDIKEEISTHQHSDINFGQTLGVTVDYMIDTRIRTKVGERKKADHVDSTGEAAGLTLEKITAHNRFMKRLTVFGTIVVTLIVLATCLLFWRHTQSAERAAEHKASLEVKHQKYGLILAEGLSDTQIDAIDDILSKMVAVTEDSLYMSQFEFTVGQWHGLMNEKYDASQKDFPMTDVSYGDIMLHLLDTLRRMTNIDGFDLPSAEEWEYAARSGAHGDSFLYAGDDDAEKVAWYAGNSDNKLHASDGRQGKEPNMLDLFDMSGNVSEICNTPMVSSTGDVLWTSCGGNYTSPESEVTVTSRHAIATDAQEPTLGFRIIIRKN